jgi:hypothetical protein
MATKADPRGRGWAINDAVTELRVAGTEQTYTLAARDEWNLGSSPDCSIPIVDPSGLVSRMHAKLVRDGNSWAVQDLGSTNGTRLDGAAHAWLPLSPGAELGIGGVTLIAQSALLVELRRYLARLLGWQNGADTDGALQTVRAAALGKIHLVLCGAGDLVPFAQRLHAIAIGKDAPFVLYETGPGVAAFDRAVNGTLCLRYGKLPRDLPLVIAGSKQANPRVSLVLCAANPSVAASTIALLGRTGVVRIPDVSSRRHELERLIGEFVAETVAELQVPGTGFEADDAARLGALEYGSLGEIAETAMNLVAYRSLGARGGARRLAVHHANLLRWLRRRGFAT